MKSIIVSMAAGLMFAGGAMATDMPDLAKKERLFRLSFN
jgi:hypothetical protein